MRFIDNDPNLVHDARFSRVYLSDSLVVADEWNLIPYLWCDELQDTIAPDMSVAKLVWNCGEFTHWFGNENIKQKPLAMRRVYIKIEILNQPVSIDVDPAVEYTWFGMIEADEFVDLLAGKNPPRTDQILTAYGLMRDLENTIVETAVMIDEAETDVVRIPRGLTFNPTHAVNNSGIGNQYRDSVTTTAGTSFAFQNKRWDGTAATKPFRWDAYTAIDHLLTHQTPKKVTPPEENTCAWKLAGLDDPLGDQHPLNLVAWYEISNVKTDRRNLKQIIDELVDRDRFVGWYVYGDDSGSEFTAYIKLFSFSDREIKLVGRSEKIAVNSDQVALSLLENPDVVDLSVTDNGHQRYDEILVEGEFITTTFSAWVEGTSSLVADWESADETAYLDGASNETAYAGLDNAGKKQRNMSVRADDKYRDVFSRFVMSDIWHHYFKRTEWGFYNKGVPYYITIDADGLEILNTANVVDVFNIGSWVSNGDDWWSRGTRFLKHLPQSQDDAVPQYVQPFVLFRVEAASTPNIDEDIWQYGEQLNADQQRSFSVGLDMLDDDLGIRLSVALAGGQQLIARDDWSGAALTPDSLDPSVTENKAFHYDEMICTVAVPWDRRVYHREPLSPSNQTAAKKVKVISVSDARLDIRLPDTATGINTDGTLATDSTGTLIRDDRNRLKSIALAAAQWYGVARQAMSLSFEKITLKIRPLNGNQLDTNPVGLGTLVTKIGIGISKSDVNSPITSIQFLLNEQRTIIQTSFFEGDFV